jgi:hypothetical protein
LFRLRERSTERQQQARVRGSYFPPRLYSQGPLRNPVELSWLLKGSDQTSWNAMQIGTSSSLILGISAYFILLGAVCVGGPVVAHKLLSAAAPPEFLVSAKATPTEDSPAPAFVEFKPYEPAAVSPRSWAPSLGRTHIPQPKAAAAVPRKKTELKSSKTKKLRHAPRKPSKEANDAYASGGSWPRPNR